MRRIIGARHAAGVRGLGSFCNFWLFAVGFWQLAGRELGSFRILGARHAVPVRELGSFRIFGVGPGLGCLPPGTGGLN